jgi:DNA-binding transcriptional LysR family regulator
MPGRIDWERQIGRRLRLRDLHVFSTVVRLGSMGKAALELGVSQPAVSEVVADLENAVGARLFDRTPRGVETTAEGSSLERHVVAAFDELKQGLRDIEFLSDPTVGEVRIGCPESISAAILQPICETFTQQYPRVVLDIDTVNTLSFAQKLRNRNLDVVLARGGWPLEDEQLVSDFNVETLYDDELVIAAGCQSPWARRRKIDISDLRDEQWILTSGDLFNYQVITSAFQMRGIEMPKIVMKTISVHLRASMVATGRFVTTFPRSVLDLHADRLGLKMLPVDLPNANWPVKIATLRNRSMSTVVKRFIASACAIAKSGPDRKKAHESK